MNRKRIALTILFCVGVLFFTGKKAEAAFPYDMEQKPVTATSIKDETVSVFADAALKNKTDEVNGRKLKIEAYRVSGKSIYGTYKSGKKSGTGWFSLDTFVVNPDYKNVYATVRDGMHIYTDRSFSKVQTTIKKYSGIIVISKKGSHSQVICDKKDHYEIGWMTSGAFSNTLVYDGREKQILADGIYEFRSGYQDNKNGGTKKQTEMEKYPKYTLKITHATHNQYYIQDAKGEYLSVMFRKSDEKNAKGTAGRYVLCWSSQLDEVNGLFEFQRLNGAFSIQNVESKYFLGTKAADDADDANSIEENRIELISSAIMSTGRSGQESHWRIHAAQKMNNTKKPFVFTQYDPEWCGTPYGGGGSMGTAGCGILSTVNAVYALTGQYMDVMELANYAVEKNYRIVGSGTDDGIFKAAAKKYGRKYGFAWDGASGSIDVLKKKLKAGDTAIVHVQGHYVAISDYNKKTKKYLLLDSNYLPKRATSAFGDWIKVDRLLSGALESQYFYFFKLSEM